MWKSCCVAVVALVASWSGLLSPALAHSPYFGQGEKINHPDFGVIEFAVLYGDGIFFADPSQVVVFDNKGYLLAATAQSEALLIRCDRSDRLHTCSIYDELRGIVFEPEYEGWARGRLIEEDGRPPRDAYPEYMDIEYGFRQRPALFREKITFEISGILNTPVPTLLAILWWSFAWLFIARIFWRLKRNGWHVVPSRAWALVRDSLSVLAFMGMSSLAAYSWLLRPYSPYFFLFVFSLGALIAGLLARPKAAIQENQS